MALKFFDRTKQEATTSGTGTFTLSGSASTGGFRTFASVHTTGDQVFYCAVDNVNNTFEVGEGTLTSGSPNWTLSRDKVKSSSNSNNKVNFAAAPEIFSTYPAENAAFSDTTLANNVVETDAVFDETLTANKALSGQFKGTLQFNKAFFTITDYTVASGQTLTVTDSADLYAVDIASGTVMDRTADFTDDVTISSNTMFSPGINAYATVTISNSVTATVSPVGTTFVNNGAGITTGGPISWKLPLTDGSDGTAIVTDGAGGFKVKGAAAGGVATLNPQGETLLSTVDFNNYLADTNYVEFIVPTSLASSTSEIESFRIDLDFLTFYSPTGTVGQNTAVFIQPMTAKDSRMSLGTAAWEWTSQYMYNSSTGYNRRSQYMTGDSNEGSSATQNGTYYGKDYGLPLTGGSQNYGTPSDWYTDTPPNFTNTDPISQWHSNMTGTIKIQNQIYAPKVSFNFDGAMAYSSGQWNYTFMVTGGHSTYRNSSQTNDYPITGEHARGYRVWFLPTDYTALSNWKISGGRLDAYVKLKQSQSQITVGDTAS
jgi:hypothetical protein